MEVVEQLCTLSTWEGEEGGLALQGPPQQHNEFMTQAVRVLSLKNYPNKIKKKINRVAKRNLFTNV